MRLLGTFGEVNIFLILERYESLGLWKDCDKQISKLVSKIPALWCIFLCHPIPLSVVKDSMVKGKGPPEPSLAFNPTNVPGI